MSIVFSKKFSTNFFSVAYMERACARTGTIYTRKKKFLVCACKTYTVYNNMQGVRKEIECTISYSRLCYVVSNTIYREMHKYAVNKNGTKRDYSIKSTFRVYYKIGISYFLTVQMPLFCQRGLILHFSRYFPIFRQGSYLISLYPIFSPSFPELSLSFSSIFPSLIPVSSISCAVPEFSPLLLSRTLEKGAFL